MKTRNVVCIILALFLHFQIKSMNYAPMESKHVVFGLLNVLINFNVNECVDRLVCDNAIEILQQDSHCPCEPVALLVEQYKKNRESYSPTYALMNAYKLTTIDFFLGQLSCSDLFTKYSNPECLADIYTYIEERCGITLGILDKAAINACIQILFGPKFKVKLGHGSLGFDQCFSINPHGWALLDFVLEVGKHNVYLMENIPSEWTLILASKFKRIFKRAFPMLTILSRKSPFPQDARCVFSFDSKNYKGTMEFFDYFFDRYKVTSENCIFIDYDSDMCKMARQHKINIVGFGIRDCLLIQPQQCWERIISGLKTYGVFERDRTYSFFIRSEYFQ